MDGYEHFSNLSPTPTPLVDTSAKTLCGPQRDKVSHDVIARPRQFVGDGLPAIMRWPFACSLLKPLPRRTERIANWAASMEAPLEIRVAIFDVPVSLSACRY